MKLHTLCIAVLLGAGCSSTPPAAASAPPPVPAAPAAVATPAPAPAQPAPVSKGGRPEIRYYEINSA